MVERAALILGSGKVGSALARAMRAAGWAITLRRGRAPLPVRRIDSSVVILAVRDAAIEPLARALAERGLIGHRSVSVFHCAGALGPAPLAPARAANPRNVHVAQLHPMISFASKRFAPSLLRGQAHVLGDARAVRVGKALARSIGLSPRTFPALDLTAYHAAAGLVANGAAALAAAGAELLERGGCPPGLAPAMLGPLLRSVAENVERLGLPEALTGPVRRGEPASVERHLRTIERLAPALARLHLAAAAAQLPLARALGEGDPAAFDAIEKVVRRADARAHRDGA